MTISINSLGYLPARAKRAFVTTPCTTFTLRDSNRKAVRTGAATGPVKDVDSGHDLWILDFSDVETEGEYVLDVDGVGQSIPFRIANDIYRFPFYLVTRAMYLWRCGTDVEAEHNGNIYRQKACHLEDGHVLPGLDLSVRSPQDWGPGGRNPASQAGAPDLSDSPQDEGLGVHGEKCDATGGWHDAGDYNKYVVNAGVTVGSMLLAWDMFPDRLRNIRLNNGNSLPGGEGRGGVGSASLPGGEGSGDALPDFLAEVKWEMDWLLKMQAEDGSVYHKMSALGFCGFIMPDEEKDPRYFCPWSSAATADFAAMCAMFARVVSPYNATYADRCLTAAVRAYDFLLAHPENHHGDISAFKTGGYTTDDQDDRLWMAAELWDATGDDRYRLDFESRLSSGDYSPAPLSVEGDRSVRIDIDWDWSHVANLGMFRYLLSGRPKDEALSNAIAAAIIKAGEAIVDVRNESGYGRSLKRYYWGSNGTIARQTPILAIANRLVRQGHESKYGGCDFVETGLDSLAYLFGRNPYNRSFVTGLGHNPPLRPHDRRSGADNIDAPWPGYLVGGGWPGALDWKDEEKSHETNEIAINWNGALIYALAWFVG